jgi:uncharacterized LabA/DUF88 family protein
MPTITPTIAPTAALNSAAILRPQSCRTRHHAGIRRKRRKANSFGLSAATDRGRVAVFVDGSNLFYAAAALGIHIDYRQLLLWAKAGSVLAGAYFYTGVDFSNRKERNFLSQMQREGYQIVQKQLMQRADGSRKANLDVEIALDMVMQAFEQAYDTAVLFSGDGDFTCVVNTVRSKGGRVEVIGLPTMTSNTLITAADRFVNLATIQQQICKSST